MRILKSQIQVKNNYLIFDLTIIITTSISIFYINMNKKIAIGSFFSFHFFDIFIQIVPAWSAI